MSRRVLDVLRRGGAQIEPEQADAVALAALVHDISHLPFGHTFEDERKLFPRHDTVARMKTFSCCKQKIAQALDASGLRDTVVSSAYG